MSKLSLFWKVKGAAHSIRPCERIYGGLVSVLVNIDAHTGGLVSKVYMTIGRPLNNFSYTRIMTLYHQNRSDCTSPCQLRQNRG